jgi:energy-coupling factor transport system permease protein
MRGAVTTYYPGTTAVHRADARVKIMLLLAYSVALFWVDTPWGMALFAAAAAWALASARVPAGAVFKLLSPVIVLAAFTVVFNAFGSDGATAGAFTIAGLWRGVFYAARMLVLVAASFAVCLTTTSTALVNGFSQLMHPLRHVRVPVDDVALVLSLALRFIPVIAEELVAVRDAQLSRGAHLQDGRLFARLRAWGSVFVPLFVGLFRRADVLGVALEARCYGANGGRPTALDDASFSAGAAAQLACGLALVCIGAVAL